ncbi:hypothetical protein GCM10027093_21330 [Paraburkholderia jirisanensis]
MTDANVISLADRRSAKKGCAPRMVIEISDNWNFRIVEGSIPARADAEELKMAASRLLIWLTGIACGERDA